MRQKSRPYVIYSTSHPEGAFKPDRVAETETRAAQAQQQQQQQQQQQLILSHRGPTGRTQGVFTRVVCGKIPEMSNVQLSCSALERLVARRTFPLHRRTSVCRNLFGPVDHDDLSREMRDKLREISELDRQRWNFNFEANTPLVGDYEWEEVRVDTTPGFYQDSVRDAGSKRPPSDPVPLDPIPSDPVPSDPVPADPVPLETPGMDVLERLAGPESSGGPVEVNQENRTDQLNSGRPAHRHVPCTRRKRPAATDNNNTHITDFFVKRKRAADKLSSDMSACHHSKSPIPLDQTPRKRIR